MASVKVYDIEGKEVETLELNDAVFGVEINEHIMHKAVVGQLANSRQGTQSAKTRSEVSGGGRKPWRQKGTGHAKKAGTTPKAFYREFRLENTAEYELGAEIKADVFAAGDKIDVTAKSKGKGYAGGLKRHGLKSGPSGHGSKYHRHAGSNGSATTPGRVFKGKKMPGHMGSVRVTIQNLEVVKIDVENNVILVKGAVPGPKKSLVMIKDTVKSGK